MSRYIISTGYWGEDRINLAVANDLAKAEEIRDLYNRLPHNGDDAEIEVIEDASYFRTLAWEVLFKLENNQLMLDDARKTASPFDVLTDEVSDDTFGNITVGLHAPYEEEAVAKATILAQKYLDAHQS